MNGKKSYRKKVETLTHGEASRINIPTAEYEAVLHEKDKSAVRVAYERRNRDPFRVVYRKEEPAGSS